MKAILLLGCVMISFSGMSQTPQQEPFTRQQIDYVFGKERPDGGLNRNMSHQLDSTTTLAYDVMDEEWYSYISNHFTYHDNGNLKTHYSETPEINETINEFNTHGKPVLYQINRWNGTEYKPESKTVYQYHTNGKNSTDTAYTYSVDHWEVARYTVYDMDSQGLVERQTTYRKVGTSYVPHSKLEFTRDQHGNILQLESFRSLNAIWDKNYKYFYTYDQNQRTESFWYQKWANGAWVNEFKVSNFYQLNNHIEELSYFWQNGMWENVMKRDFQYNSHNPSSAYLMPQAHKENDHQIIGSQSYFNNNGLFGYIDSVFYHYSLFEPTGIDEPISQNYFKVIENPVINEIRIKNNEMMRGEILLYNIGGKLVYSDISSESVIRVSTNTLKSGIYLLQIKYNGKLETFRVLKK